MVFVSCILSVCLLCGGRIKFVKSATTLGRVAAGTSICNYMINISTYKPVYDTLDGSKREFIKTLYVFKFYNVNRIKQQTVSSDALVVISRRLTKLPEAICFTDGSSF